jgi:hypothetical protein
MKTLYLLVPLAPLVGAMVAGFFGRAVGRAGTHWITILGVLVSFLASCWIFADVLQGNSFNGSVYTWLSSGGVRLEIGFLIDPLLRPSPTQASIAERWRRRPASSSPHRSPATDAGDPSCHAARAPAVTFAVP